MHHKWRGRLSCLWPAAFHKDQSSDRNRSWPTPKTWRKYKIRSRYDTICTPMTCSRMRIQSHPSVIRSSTNSRNVQSLSAIGVGPRDCSWTRRRRSACSSAPPSTLKKYQLPWNVLPWNVSPSETTLLNQWMLFAIWECYSTKILTWKPTFLTFHEPASSTCGDCVRFVNSLVVTSQNGWYRHLFCPDLIIAMPC